MGKLLCSFDYITAAIMHELTYTPRCFFAIFDSGGSLDKLCT